MNNVIKADLYRYGGLRGYSGLFKGLMNSPGFRFMFFFRIASDSGTWSGFVLFCKFLLRRYSYKYGFQIPISTNIGEGFYIGHFGTIVISSKVIIGKNCNIAHGVTIGKANRGRLKGYPVIGDHVWIGTGAVIVGKVTIGSNILIAPNSFVNFDVPDNSLVIGNPAKIIAKENPTEGYIAYIPVVQEQKVT